MTNEEAIELLYDIQTDAVYNVLSDEKEALEMAIKALKQQPCEDAITKRPTARWERLVDDFKKCSKCGRPVKFYRNYKYCPGCGSEMSELKTN